MLGSLSIFHGQDLEVVEEIFNLLISSYVLFRNNIRRTETLTGS